MRAAAISLLAFGACATSAEVSGSRPGATKSGYDTILATWTRDGQLMHELDTALELTATYKAWQFRSAETDRRVALFKLPDARHEQMLESQRADHARLHEFYVAAATHRDQWNDLDRPASSWRIVLICDDQLEIEALHIRKHEKISVITQTLFPYTGTFSEGYDIEFSRTTPGGAPVCGPGTRRMALRFSGPLGTMILTWDLR